MGADFWIILKNLARCCCSSSFSDRGSTFDSGFICASPPNESCGVCLNPIIGLSSSSASCFLGIVFDSNCCVGSRSDSGGNSSVSFGLLGLLGTTSSRIQLILIRTIAFTFGASFSSSISSGLSFRRCRTASASCDRADFSSSCLRSLSVASLRPCNLGCGG